MAWVAVLPILLVVAETVLLISEHQLAGFGRLMLEMLSN